VRQHGTPGDPLPGIMGLDRYAEPSAIDQELLAKLPVHKQYPTGERWVEIGEGDGWEQIGREARDEQRTAAQQIGKALGHCPRCLARV
jgi:hypothetical protein